MNYKKDTFVPDLLLTIAVILTIIALIFLYRRGYINLSLVVYIIVSVLLVFVNTMTYLPILSIAFIILKITGRLTLAWVWIVATLVIDVLYEFDVAEIRKTFS